MRHTTTTTHGYDAGAMLLHWAIAILIVIQIAGGFMLERTEILPDAFRFPAIQWHKTFGLMILTLTLARIAWRLLNPPPEGAPISKPERLLAGLVHFLFYALMIVVPLSGWLMVSASTRQIPTLLFLSPAFPFAHLPVPAGARENLEGIAVNAHTLLAYSFVALLVLHVAGALKHSVVDRAPSFSRMLPVGHLTRRPIRLLAVPVALALGAAFVVTGVEAGRTGHGRTAVVASSAASPKVATDGWQIDMASSKLGFEVAFSGQPVAGSVGSWNAAIVFDPANPSTGSARIDVDPTSVTVAEPFVQSNVAGVDGFDTANHPKVTITLDRFETAPDGFVARGALAIRGKSLPVEVPFTFTQEAGNAAHVVGSATIDRLAFGLGAGNDPTGEFLGKDVIVKLDLRATPAGQAPQPAT